MPTVVTAEATNIVFKRGDSLALSCVYSIDGTPAALPAGIRSQLRNHLGTLVQELTVTVLDAPTGQFLLSADATATAAWNVGILYCDIQYTDSSGKVSSTDTFSLTVISDITHD